MVASAIVALAFWGAQAGEHWLYYRQRAALVRADMRRTLEHADRLDEQAASYRRMGRRAGLSPAEASRWEKSADDAHKAAELARRYVESMERLSRRYDRTALRP
jgi:hypothetical protein